MPEILQLVPWRHQTIIVSKCDTIQAALFYLNKVIEGNMSRAELEHAIEAKLYEHTGWSLRGITTPVGVASYQLQEVYDRTMLEMRQQSSEMDEE